MELSIKERALDVDMHEVVLYHTTSFQTPSWFFVPSRTDVTELVHSHIGKKRSTCNNIHRRVKNIKLDM